MTKSDPFHLIANRRPCAAFLLLLAPAVVRSQDAAEVYKRAKDSVVLIEGERHIGSGVIVPGGCSVVAGCTVGWVVTNYHVISGETSVKARFASGVEVQTGEVVASDSDGDLAVLRLIGGPFAKSELGDSESVVVGQRIIVISNPMGLQGSVTEGLVSGVREIEGKELLQISAPISPGSSGGPVFDLRGRVVGIATATLVGAQNLNLAIPSSRIQTLLRNPQAGRLSELSPLHDSDHSEDAVRPILQRVSKYLANEMTEEAETQLRAGLQQYEFAALLRLELAKLLIRTRRSEEAMQQLRITNKLDAGQWLPLSLMGHLYLRRWLEKGDLSDRQAAYKLYRDLLDNRALPSVRYDLLVGMLARMRSPEGEWRTGEPMQERVYSVIALSAGGFHMDLEDLGRWLSQPTAQVMQNTRLHLAFTPFDAQFRYANEPGKFTGTSSYIDATCDYAQSLVVAVGRDGSTMDVQGTITKITGVQRLASAALGKGQAEGWCIKPGGDGSRLTLHRVRSKENFFELDVMVDADTRPLVLK